MTFKYSLRQILFGVVSLAFFPASFVLVYLQQDQPWMCFSNTCIDATSSMQTLIRKDLAGFYIFLALSGATLILAKTHRKTSKLLSKRVSKTSSITAAELSWFIFALVALAASFAWDIQYWWFRRLSGWKDSQSSLVFQTLFDASGNVLSVIVGFVVLPVSKNSFLATFMNLPYTSLVRLHIWFGRLLFWCSIFHAVMSDVAPNKKQLPVVDTANVITNGAQQETFGYGLCMYTVDGFTRLTARLFPDSVTSVIFEECGYITVTIATTKAGAAKPGQFMRVNFPSVSLLEYHPWSIARASDESVTFMFGVGVDGEWGSKVAEKLKSLDKGATSGNKILAYLQGPYGKEIGIIAQEKEQPHDLVLFYVGGTGFAATVKAIDIILARNGANVDDTGKTKVVLAWSARRNKLAEISLLQSWQNVSREYLELELFQTGNGSHTVVTSAVNELHMNLNSKLKNHVSLGNEKIDLKVGVFICGPPGFTKDALKSVSIFSAENPNVSLDVEVESFNL
ncbi:NADPH oxidase 4 [Physocladia obscura]|uniref:NADPH oxidase 4 n=1 Tax=Physocladia obscura TaxID=109957 RepID=A0AAD5X6Q1_9FUNG|nr:NADPH oxidase 4 [Physocladia obscura]